MWVVVLIIKIGTMKHGLFVFIFLSTILISCDSDDELEVQTEIPGPVVEITDYPLSVGNNWNYKMEVEVTDGPEPYFKEYVVDFKVVSDTTINGINVKKVRSTESLGQQPGTDRLGFRYLAQTDWGLEKLAFSGSSVQVFFKNEEEIQIPDCSFIDFKHEETTSIIILDTALNYMKLPAIDGELWLSGEFGGSSSGAKFKRKWTGFYTVTTDAGSFNCMRLDLFGDSDDDEQPTGDDLHVIQYISPQFGLVKEIHESQLNYGSGETASYRRVAELTNKNF